MSLSETGSESASTPPRAPGDMSDRSAEGIDVVNLVAKALQGIRFGEVVVVVVNGQVDRIDRVQKSRPYRARRDHRD